MSRERILVLDDESKISLLCSKILEKLGYDVIAPPYGAEAILMARSGSYDLLLTDLKMPDIDGFCLCREISALFPSIATVLLSGNATCDRFAGASGMGIDAFVSKPFTAGELSEGINIALSRVRSRRDTACAERLIGLLELHGRLPSASSTRAVFDEVVNIVGERISADRVALMMYSECGGELRIAASKGLPADVKPGMRADSGGSISGYVLRNGNGIVINGSTSGEPEIASRMRFRDHLSSGICVPLRAGGETFGVITAGRCSPSAGFGESELGLLSGIAGRVASGLEQNNASFA